MFTCIVQYLVPFSTYLTLNNIDTLYLGYGLLKVIEDGTTDRYHHTRVPRGPSSVVTMAVSCIVFEIKQAVGYRQTTDYTDHAIRRTT